MGKSQKPLTILIHSSFQDWPEIQELASKGHTVVVSHDIKIANVNLEDCDLILSPVAWRMDEQHRKYLKLAVEAGRKRRYPK